MAMPVSRWQFTVEDYVRMWEAGILTEDDRVELLEGEIVKMAPIGPPHAGCVNQLNRLFTSRLGDRAVVSVQNPVRLRMLSMPQPDLALLRPRRDLYSESHAEENDVLLVVEVSWSSTASDRLLKMPIYARAGIRQAWLVDLEANVVEVYRLAGEWWYGEPERIVGEDRTVIDAFPDVIVTAAEITGRVAP